MSYKWKKKGNFAYLVDSSDTVIEAYSYDTMIFGCIDKLALMNKTKYSATTSKHQTMLSAMLPEVHPHGHYVELSEVPPGLGGSHALLSFYTSFNRRQS